MTIIEEYLERYKEEYDFYKQLTLQARDRLEKEIFNMGIKSIVTYRTKRVDSLKEKLIRRNEKKKYSSLNDIEKDIVDLAGIRVALYFPSDRRILSKAMEELFEVQAKKEFPTDPHKPKSNKRFSGYWATHYRVKFKKESDLPTNMTSKIIEIQVASVLMHAWSEVEHDLVYKPLSGDVSEEELSILDEINGLVMAGEIGLERLQKAYNERTKRKKEITDRYQLSMLVLNNFKNLDLTKVQLGDTSLLNNYLEAVSKMETDEVLKSFEKVNLNFSETVTDQILMEIITKDYDKNLNKYLASFTPDPNKVFVYEAFIKAWIILEKAVQKINEQNHFHPKNNSTSNFSLFSNSHKFSEEEMEDLKELRILRNKLLHGYNAISEEELKPCIERLKEIVQNTLLEIHDDKKKEKLIKRLQRINP